MVNAATSIPDQPDDVQQAIANAVLTTFAMYMYNRSNLTAESKAQLLTSAKDRKTQLDMAYKNEFFYKTMSENPEIVHPPNYYFKPMAEIQNTHFGITSLKFLRISPTAVVHPPPIDSSVMSVKAWCDTFALCFVETELPLTNQARTIISKVTSERPVFTVGNESPPGWTEPTQTPPEWTGSTQTQTSYMAVPLSRVQSNIPVNFSEAFPNTTFTFETSLPNAPQIETLTQPPSGVPVSSAQAMDRNSRLIQQVLQIMHLHNVLIRDIMAN
jgi:hypothetical protein